MAKLNTEEVKKITSLANLPLSKKEETGFSSQLSKIVDYFQSLSGVGTQNIDPTFVPMDLENVTREDKTEPSLSQEEALKNAEQVKNGLFVVKSIKNIE